ncbi:3-hydroxyacyl-ACP dehydratase FabZ [Lactobacillus sp. PV037]|nr:3-hydroxyacyl-ACP dehydratase FabZ [Lactobacillus sp. PV037]
MNKVKLNAVEIQQIIGYQPPLCLLDRVISLELDDFLIATASISINEPFFKGHFPDNPVMPGVLIVESMVQGAQILFKNKFPKLQLKKIKKARFKKMVKPGDELVMKLKVLDLDNKICDAKVYVNDEVACSSELVFS